MADAADIATEREYILRQEGLARLAAARPSGPGRAFCEDCGEPIPAARRAALPGVRRCLTCQQEHER